MFQQTQIHIFEHKQTSPRTKITRGNIYIVFHLCVMCERCNTNMATFMK